MDLFARLEAERRTGSVFTLADWLRDNPPEPSSLRQTIAGIPTRVAEGTPFMHAVRELLDEYPMRTDKGAAIGDEPARIGPWQDAYLAALAEHLAVKDGLPVPAWTRSDGRFLSRFWFASAIPGFRARLIQVSPAAFRRRGLFVDPKTLVRV